MNYSDDFRYPVCFNVTGHPALTIPMGLNRDGLPNALQVVGPPNSEPRLIEFARRIEALREGFVKPRPKGYLVRICEAFHLVYRRPWRERIMAADLPGPENHPSSADTMLSAALPHTAGMTHSQDARPHWLVWFEIPAVDFERAVRFYETLFAVKLTLGQMGPAQLAVFPYERPAVSGCVMAAPQLTPSTDGVVVYLNAGPELQAVLNRVAEAGGSVVLPPTALPPGMGVFAKIRDTEGNVVGLHALA